MATASVDRFGLLAQPTHDALITHTRDTAMSICLLGKSFEIASALHHPLRSSMSAYASKCTVARKQSLHNFLSSTSTEGSLSVHYTRALY
jgi:hypothetical protein